MLIRKRDLANISDEKYIEVDINVIEHNDDPFLKRLENNKGYISFFYDLSDKLRIEYDLSGVMVLPDPLTLEDVYVDYHLDNEEDVVFNEDEEGFYIYGDIELKDLIMAIVLPEVPISVENCDKTMYHNGDGWSIISEEEYDKDQKNKIDPRLAKLLEYKEEK